jgi:hypothetical protein
MKTVLIVTYNPLHREPRVLRQVNALKKEYKIITTGITPVDDENVFNYSVLEPFQKRTFFQKVKKRLLLYLWLIKNYNNWLSIKMAKRLRFKHIFSYIIPKPDVIIAHDWTGLYLASGLKKKKGWDAKIYFDAHEYAPRQLDNSLRWLIQEQPVRKKALKNCKADICFMTTVCEGIAREYESFFKFPNGFVKVITNAPEYNASLKPNKIENDFIRLIHHGGAMKARRMELMIQIMDYLDPDKYELTFMLVESEPEYYKYLVKTAEKHRNIKFLKAVGFSEIVPTLNRYDIGIFLLLPDIFNYKYALPNKLFEFIQSRLAIAIGPSIEMAGIVDRYNLGVISQEFTPQSMAQSISQLTPERIMEYKKNANTYAKELSAEENIVRIKKIINEMMKG